MSQQWGSCSALQHRAGNARGLGLLTLPAAPTPRIPSWVVCLVSTSICEDCRLLNFYHINGRCFASGFGSGRSSPLHPHPCGSNEGCHWGRVTNAWQLWFTEVVRFAWHVFRHINQGRFLDPLLVSPNFEAHKKSFSAGPLSRRLIVALLLSLFIKKVIATSYFWKSYICAGMSSSYTFLNICINSWKQSSIWDGLWTKKYTNVDRCTDDTGLRKSNWIFNYIIQSRRALTEESPISEVA